MGKVRDGYFTYPDDVNGVVCDLQLYYALAGILVQSHHGRLDLDT